ncbi:hypothetical protein [Legionella jordanis]|uniref:Coiled coil protein n=1 Tax=Legionella jordanis TaxID=456 RepID=A0A0W0VAA5_9GAMM|nr:hypothetical protein [Legionella jordanis]KTD17032.1 coiled coil protein [Legionella jordanis]RMX03170.1 hypothetical protein EAW55_06990 [Legionella jordanis]RMX18691.1 hypothetical protein EAS68_07705 [Legionella jordanis]VEH12772.1 coiled coil protein [Legionella jordanis]HAT8713083.1 hypothetical protein [Legionella jordanis]
MDFTAAVSFISSLSQISQPSTILIVVATLAFFAVSTIDLFRRSFGTSAQNNLTSDEVKFSPEHLQIHTCGLITKRLSAAQMEEAKTLIYTAELPGSSHNQKLLAKLKVSMEQYENLDERLKKIEELDGKNTLVDGDELLPSTDIAHPVLLFKAYYKNEELRAVPASTKISDAENLKLLLERHPIHTITRESYDNPLEYKNKPTFFLYHNYTGYSFELETQAKRIKKKIEQLGKMDAESESQAKESSTTSRLAI